MKKIGWFNWFVFLYATILNSSCANENCISLGKFKIYECTTKKIKPTIIIVDSGLKIYYYGSNYSKEYLERLLNNVDSLDQQINVLYELNFDKIVKLKKNVLKIYDPTFLGEISFDVVYRNDNVVKRKIYTKASPNAIMNYYSQYSKICGVKSNSPIKLKDLNISTEKLKDHFLRLGYTYVDIGYEKVFNKDTGFIDITYKIDLDELKPNKLTINGGNLQVNNLIRSRYPKYLPSLFEVNKNYFIVSQFDSVIASTYHSKGFFNAKVDSYFDSYNKEIVYEINLGEKFTINECEIDTSNVEELLTESQKKKISAIIQKNDFCYSQVKINSILDIITKAYENSNSKVLYKLDKNTEDNTVNITFYFQFINFSQKKILSKINVKGNNKISSNQVSNILSKKLGDEVSLDDVYSMKRSLMQREWFRDANLKLEEKNDSTYELIVDLKEQPILWDLPSLQIGSSFSDDSDSSVNISIGKKNFLDSSLNAKVDFNLSGPLLNSKLSSKKPWRVMTDCSINGVNSVSSTPYSIRLSGIFDAKDLEEIEGGKIFNKKSGHYVGVDIFPVAKWFDLGLGFRKLGFEKGNPWKLQSRIFHSFLPKVVRSENFLSVQRLNVSASSLGYFPLSIDFTGGIRNSIFLFKNTLFSMNIEFDVFGGYSHFLSNNEKYRKLTRFQTIPTFDLGYWGVPELFKGSDKHVHAVTGGDAYGGFRLQLRYNLDFSILPDLFHSAYVYYKFEAGFIADAKNIAKNMNLQEHIRYGSYVGVSFPVFQGISLSFYHFWPCKTKEFDLIAKKGVSFSFSIDPNAMMDFEQN